MRFLLIHRIAFFRCLLVLTSILIFFNFKPIFSIVSSTLPACATPTNNLVFEDASSPTASLRILWQETLEHTSRGALGYSDGYLFICDDHATIYALDALTGQLHWQKKVPEQTNVGITLDRGRLFYPGESGILYSYEQASGELIRIFPLAERVVLPVLFHEGKLLVFTEDHYLQVFLFPSLDNLHEVQFRFPDQVKDLPVIHDNQIFVHTQHNRIYAIQLETGHELWHKELREVVVAPLVYWNNSILALGDHRLYMFQADTGATRWIIRHGYPFQYLSQGINIIASRDRIFLPSRGFDAETGRLVFSNWGQGTELGKQLILGNRIVFFRKGIFKHSTLFIESIDISTGSKHVSEIFFQGMYIQHLCVGNRVLYLLDSTDTITAIQYDSFSTSSTLPNPSRSPNSLSPPNTASSAAE